MEISYLADFPHESKTIARWYFDEWGHSSPEITFEKVHDNILEKITNRKDIPLSILIHKESELVAVAELKYRENKHHPEYEHWLGGLFVAPTHRGEGLCSVLIAKAKEHIKLLGISKLYLQAEEKNVALYRKHDFLILHNTEHFGLQTIIMVWESGV